MDTKLISSELMALKAARAAQVAAMDQKISLLEQYLALETGVKPVVQKAKSVPKATSDTPASDAPASDAPRRRGRPAGSKNKPKESDGTTDDKAKAASLSDLLSTIAMQAQKPLTNAEFVTACREAGYVSKAKDFPNMVMQALTKLVKGGAFSKNKETREYTVIQKDAA